MYSCTLTLLTSPFREMWVYNPDDQEDLYRWTCSYIQAAWLSLEIQCWLRLQPLAELSPVEGFADA
jgi:hypothetical protein